METRLHMYNYCICDWEPQSFWLCGDSAICLKLNAGKLFSGGWKVHLFTELSPGEAEGVRAHLVHWRKGCSYLNRTLVSSESHTSMNLLWLPHSCCEIIWEWFFVIGLTATTWIFLDCTALVLAHLRSSTEWWTFCKNVCSGAELQPFFLQLHVSEWLSMTTSLFWPTESGYPNQDCSCKRNRNSCNNNLTWSCGSN